MASAAAKADAAIALLRVDQVCQPRLGSVPKPSGLEPPT